jgi:hypothetical protein
VTSVSIRVLTIEVPIVKSTLAAFAASVFPIEPSIVELRIRVGFRKRKATTFKDLTCAVMDWPETRWVRPHDTNFAWLRQCGDSEIPSRPYSAPPKSQAQRPTGTDRLVVSPQALNRSAVSLAGDLATTAISQRDQERCHCDECYRDRDLRVTEIGDVVPPKENGPAARRQDRVSCSLSMVERNTAP